MNDVYILRHYNKSAITQNLYSTTMKIVHQPLIHNLLSNNYHKQSSITSFYYMFPSFYYRGQSGIQTYKGNHMDKIYLWAFCTPKFGIKQLNRFYFAWQQTVAEPTFCRYISPPRFPHVCCCQRFRMKLSYRRFTKPQHAYLSVSQHSFLQFQLVFFCYAKDRWSSLHVYPTKGCTQPLTAIY